MPKPSKARKAALQREEARRLELQARSNPTLLQPAESPVVEALALQPRGSSRTSKWRDQNGKTAKSRAVKMQPSVLKYFSPIGAREEIIVERGIDSQGNDSALEGSDAGVEEAPTQDPEFMACDNTDIASDELGTSTEDSECIETQSPLSPSIPTVDVDDPLEATGLSDSPRQSLAQPQRNSTKGSGAEADEQAERLAAHEQTYQEIAKVLEREDGKLNERRKRAGCNSSKSKKLVQDTLELHALKQFNNLRIEYHRKKAKNPNLKLCPSLKASTTIAKQLGKTDYYARRLREKLTYLHRVGELQTSKQGKGGAHRSLLSEPQVAAAIQVWVKGVIPVEKGGYIGRVRPWNLQKYMNEYCLPEHGLEGSISKRTAARWLNKLGFRVCNVQKGVYVDGHEREEVVEARRKYIEFMENEVFPYSSTYSLEEGVMVEKPPTLKPGETESHVIAHDEVCFHVNDLSRTEWVARGEQPLRQKGRGRIVHVSDFIVERTGRLYLTESEREAQMKLPCVPKVESTPLESLKPEPTVDVAPVVMPNTSAIRPTTATAKKKKVKKETKGRKKGAKKKVKETLPDKPSEPTGTSANGRTFAENSNWDPNASSAGGEGPYRLPSFDARRIIYPGANGDPWWDMPQLIAQTKDAISIFNYRFPNARAVFVFDCSSAHESYASDALLAHKMNRFPGGKQPRMRDTTIPGTDQIQSMVFPDDYKGVDKDGNPVAGKAKGMEQVLAERGLLSVLEAAAKSRGGKIVGTCELCRASQAERERVAKEAKSRQAEIEGLEPGCLARFAVSRPEEQDGNRPIYCCMQRLLSVQDDFKNEKPLLQLIIEGAGHTCLFLPKFHCELNPIELVWGQAKRQYRESADGTFPTAKKLVPKCLDAVSTDTIRRYFNLTWRYLDAYRYGLSIRQAEFAVKKYKSHRRIPASVMMDLSIMNL